MENLNLLNAMMLLAETLNYSNSYKKDLIDEIQSMIEQEEHSIEYLKNHSEPDFDSAGFSVLDRN